MTSKLSRRWTKAQSLEKASVGTDEDVRIWIDSRRKTWADLAGIVVKYIDLNENSRILDVGCGPTSIFLGIRTGRKFAVDPDIGNILREHPFLKNLPEYADVKFVSSPIEYFTREKFNAIFMINMLDHVDRLSAVRTKLDNLLEPGGWIVVVVDCYDETRVKRIMEVFDVDLPHPHHFGVSDVSHLFWPYDELANISVEALFDRYTFRGEKRSIDIWRIDKLLSRMILHTIYEGGRPQGVVFTLKYFTCYSLALLVALFGARKWPIHPLKKPRLLIFKKPLPTSTLTS